MGRLDIGKGDSHNLASITDFFGQIGSPRRQNLELLGEGGLAGVLGGGHDDTTCRLELVELGFVARQMTLGDGPFDVCIKLFVGHEKTLSWGNQGRSRLRL